MITQEQKDDLKKYITDNIEFFDERYSAALTKMDHCRCPLQYADQSLYDEIVKYTEEWMFDNDADWDMVNLGDIFFM